MKLSESRAASCRYGDEALEAFGENSELIWEESEVGWQGWAKILIKTTDDRFAHYEWDYGSCSGCDGWEAANLSSEQIVKIMQEGAEWFDDEEDLTKYLCLREKQPGEMRKALEVWRSNATL